MTGTGEEGRRKHHTNYRWRTWAHRSWSVSLAGPAWSERKTKSRWRSHSWLPDVQW